MSSQNQYKGKAGHLAVMSELAWRGYNVALPEIDKGDDIFTVNDGSGAMLRVQVKTSSGKRQERVKSYKYSFNVRRAAIENHQSPELYFVFACRSARGFRFLVMSRGVLRDDLHSHNVGSPGETKKDSRRLDIQIHDHGRAFCSNLDWTRRLEDWAAWPILKSATE